MFDIRLETDLFEHRHTKPHFINSCCFGEDFAAWLKSQLSPLESCGYTLSDLIQEDYGWGFWASYGADPFWVAIAYAGIGPQEAPAEWAVSVTYDPGLNLIKRIFHRPSVAALTTLQERVSQILSATEGIRILDSP